MQLYFIRHGETEFNLHHQLMGQRIDAPLDDRGLQQAHEVIAKLPKDFAVIYSSPLKRAAQTAKVIADFFDKDIIISQELRERDFGTLSGKTWAEINQEAGQDMESLDAALAYDYRPYGGESSDQVKARLKSFIEALQASHQDGTVVVVTHFGLISIMNSLYSHDEQHNLTNTSVHKFTI